MTKTQLQIAAQMLDIASDEFSNHGCNDFDFPNTAEHREFVRSMMEADGWLGQDAEPHISSDGATIYVMDSVVMEYCAKLLRWEAERA